TLGFSLCARGVEPWADKKLPVTDGLELWLDASRIEPGVQGTFLIATKDGKVLIWADASGKKHNMQQSRAEAQPTLGKVGDAQIVCFDGLDDPMRIVNQKGEDLKAFTVFIVAAPRANPGEFRGLFALNAPNGRDYETGLTIDLGPGGTPRFTQLNVEGKGFGGAQNLLKPGGDFGKLYQLEVRGTEKSVRLFTDGAANGERAWNPAPLSLAELTVGARYYTNGPGKQEVRGFARCDIAEVLLFNRTLSDDETKKVREYLNAKHAKLKENLPPEAPGIGE